MKDDDYTPDEFARLMALPEGHPDRVAAIASTRFDASRRMLAEFARPGDALLSEEEIAAASAQLARRLTDSGALASPPAADSGNVTPPPSRPRPIVGIFGWLRVPAVRTAFAFAGAAIVVGFGWWSTHRPAPVETMRGIREPGPFEVSARREGEALVLGWQAVAGADAYRIVFLGAGLSEAAHLDVANDTTITLRAGALPAGINAGARVSIEVVALSRGALIATTPTSTVLLP